VPKILTAVALIAIAASPAAQTQRPLQADGLVRLLADLETTLESGQADALQPILSSALGQADRAVLQRAMMDGAPTGATVRERNRTPLDNGVRLLVQAFISRGQQGRILTWQITAQPKERSPDRYEIIELRELAAFPLFKLVLDPSKPFAVRNLTFHAPDLTLKVVSGTAFVAQSSGSAALVLRGSGEVHFAPADPAEQGQLAIYAGHPALDVKFDSAFLRISTDELEAQIANHALVPSPSVRADFARAQDVFEAMSGRSFRIDLHDLSDERWSVEPQQGTVVVDFHTRRFGWLTYARSPGDAEDLTLFQRDAGRNIALYASKETLATRGRFFSEDMDVPYDVQTYGLDLTFDPSRFWISGRESIRVKAKRDLGSITLKLSSSLAVSSISSPTFGYLLGLRVVGQNSLIVSLPDTLPRDQELVLDIFYSGRLSPQTPDRSSVSPDERPIDVADTAKRAELDFAPEPRYLYSGNVYWYPQPPVGDYALAGMRLTVPSEYQIVATGALIKSTLTPVDAAGRGGDIKYARTVEFIADRPMHYLACVISRFAPAGSARVPVPGVAPRFAGMAIEPGALENSVQVEVVSSPQRLGQNRQLASRTADILKFYANLMGEAPFPVFTLAAVDDNLPGGHSPAYLSIWQQPRATTPFSWRDDPAVFDDSPFFILAHEIAHQWWGQGVGVKNYHEQWLSEGLAQYFAMLYVGQDRGPDQMRQMLSLMRRSSIEYSAKGPIYLGYRLGYIGAGGHALRGLIYNKSAVVMQMLRRLIGEEAFLSGLRRYYRQWRFQKAGIDDLRAAFEADARMPLGRFFDRWILGSSVPRVRTSWRVEPGGETATVHLEQIGEVFDFPWTVTVQYADGKSEDVTIPVTTATVDHRLTLHGAVRRIVTKDELTLAIFE